jgi:hypothetical protein
MQLTGVQSKRLHEALLDAFPTEAALARMVRFGLDQPLALLAPSTALEDMAFKLIEWAEAQDRLPDLLRAARDANPSNHALRTLATESWAIASSSPLVTAYSAAMQPQPWHNLPQRTYLQFVGRHVELAKLFQLLLPTPFSRHFLITLVGIGGVGKSALALECAFHYVEHNTDLPPAERFAASIWVSAKREFLTTRGIQPRLQAFTNLVDLERAIAAVLDQPAILQATGIDRSRRIAQALTRYRTLSRLCTFPTA